MVPDDEKFRELILLVAARSEGDPPFGATKLNKLLFYADFVAFLRFGRAITGHVYQRLENGPAPRRILPIVRELKKDGSIAVADRHYFGRVQRRVVALREPNLSRFSPEEVDLVDKLVRDCWRKSAREMSAISHQFRGWKLAKDGEDIPYEVATVQFERPTACAFGETNEFRSELGQMSAEFFASDGK